MMLRTTVGHVVHGVTAKEVESEMPDRPDVSLKNVPAGVKVTVERNSHPEAVEDEAEALAAKIAYWFGTEYTGKSMVVA